MRYLLPIAMLLLLACSTPALTAGPRILFDQGHGQAFTIDQDGELQLGQLAEQFRSSGWQVDASSGPLTPANLANIDALVISGAFKPLNDAEISAIGDFLQSGGRLAIMLHIAQPLVPLLGRLGVASANGVVREGNNELILDQEPLNFKVMNLSKHPLNKGLPYFALYGGWPLLPTHDNARAIAMTSPTAWVDLNRDKILSPKDAMQEFGVLVTGAIGKGEFAVFADDAIFQNRFLSGENVKLAENLSRWMMQGKAQTGMSL